MRAAAKPLGLVVSGTELFTVLHSWPLTFLCTNELSACVVFLTSWKHFGIRDAHRTIPGGFEPWLGVVLNSLGQKNCSKPKIRAGVAVLHPPAVQDGSEQ